MLSWEIDEAATGTGAAGGGARAGLAGFGGTAIGDGVDGLAVVEVDPAFDDALTEEEEEEPLDSLD